MQGGHLWIKAPEFRDDLLIVTSWGPEIMRENNKGGKWKFLEFKKGYMLWLDTICFAKGVKGKKLEVAEIFANYFIGKKFKVESPAGYLW